MVIPTEMALAGVTPDECHRIVNLLFGSPAFDKESVLRFDTSEYPHYSLKTVNLLPVNPREVATDAEPSDELN